MTDYTERAKRYLILIDLPGCVATGGTLEDVEREMQAAIALHLEGLAEDGEPIPEPSGPGV